MAADRVCVEFRDECAVLQMRNGENRFNLLMLSELDEALDKVERSEETTFLITTGDGKFYSNGLDLEWLSKCSAEETTQFAKEFSFLLTRLLTFPMPTVAALNGHAFAGGAMLAFAHDYRVMRTEKGWMSLPEIHLNIRFGPGMLPLIREKIGNPNVLTDAILMGKRFTAEECLASGMVDEVCGVDTLLATAVQVGRKALGGRVIGRDIMHTMKMDVYEDIINGLTFQKVPPSREEGEKFSRQRIESKL